MLVELAQLPRGRAWPSAGAVAVAGQREAITAGARVS